jgi:hypothetical protein
MGLKEAHSAYCKAFRRTFLPRIKSVSEALKRQQEAREEPTGIKEPVERSDPTLVSPDT